jgi:hypothetical protein
MCDLCPHRIEAPSQRRQDGDADKGRECSCDIGRWIAHKNAHTRRTVSHTAELQNFIIIEKMSWARLKEYSAELLGLPSPPDGAPIEETYKWYVAGQFLSVCRDMRNPIQGKISATNFILATSDDDDGSMPLAKMIPHVEKALGRKLTAAEIALHKIEHV